MFGVGAENKNKKRERRSRRPFCGGLHGAGGDDGRTDVLLQLSESSETVGPKGAAQFVVGEPGRPSISRVVVLEKTTALQI